MRHVLTTEQIAAISAGGREIDIEATAPGAGTPTVDPVKVAAEAARVAAEAEAATAAAAAAAATAAAAAAAPAKPVDAVSVLTAQLKDKDAELLAANVKLANLTLEAASVPDLLKIAQASIGGMQIALGGNDTSATLAGKDVVTEHKRVDALFKAKFPTGRLSAAVEDNPATDTTNLVTADFKRRLAASTK